MQPTPLERRIYLSPHVIEGGEYVPSVIAQTPAEECEAVGVLPATTLEKSRRGGKFRSLILALFSAAATHHSPVS